MTTVESMSAAPAPRGARVGGDPSGYPAMAAQVNQVEPVPRRIRGFLGGERVVDTVRALYVWEWANYPQYYIPADDIRTGVLVDEGHVQRTRRGSVTVQGVHVGDVRRTRAARLVTDSPIAGLNGTVRFEWDALDSWFEEDEQVFVHPRNPYTRVDALRSSRHVRVVLEGELLAESHSPVLLFETGLPTRYYLDRSCLDLRLLRRTETRTACPYKGETSDYWTAEVGGRVEEDVAWSYRQPFAAVAPIAGLVAFYNDRVELTVDGVSPEPEPDLSQ